MTDQERIALDSEEAESLPIHVKMCAMRHAQIMKEVKEVKRIGLALIGVICMAYWPQLSAVLSPLARAAFPH